MLYEVACVGTRGMLERNEHFLALHGLLILLLLERGGLWHQVTSVSQKRQLVAYFRSVIFIQLELQ